MDVERIVGGVRRRRRREREWMGPDGVCVRVGRWELVGAGDTARQRRRRRFE